AEVIPSQKLGNSELAGELDNVSQGKFIKPLTSVQG
ncbi:unnamed protein product, partial [marine sediment metagenome]